MKKTISIIVSVIIAVSMISCSPQKDELKILTEDYPPLSFMADGEISGYGTDVVNAIQDELGMSNPIQLLSWEEAYNTALNEANVVIFTIDKTPEREEKFHFIGPLGSNVASFYTYSDNELQIEDLEAAKAVPTIATTTNWFTEQYLQERGFENLKSMNDPLQTLRSLKNKEADLAVFTDVTLPELLREAEIDRDELQPVMQLLTTDYYIAISKSTPQSIVSQWQNAFEGIKNKGMLEDLKQKWFDSEE